MWKNIEILNFSQQKEEKGIWCQNQIVILLNFSQKFISNRNEKEKEIVMNKPVYLGISILELSKILIYEFWYD